MRRIIDKLQNKLRNIIFGPLVIYSPGGFSGGRLIGTPEQIGDFSIIIYGGDVIIGKNVKIGYGVIILSASTITGSKDLQYIKEPVKISDNVEIGSNVVVLPGVTIGDNATIAAGAVLNKEVPPNSVVAGVPAKVVKWKRNSEN